MTVYVIAQLNMTDRAAYDRGLAAAPKATHVRHDHHTAGPVFLHVGRAAIPHGVAAGIIPGIDAIGSGLVRRIDAQAGRRPNPALGGYLGADRLRRLHRPHCGWRGLRARPNCGQRKNACNSGQYCRRPGPHHHAHHEPVAGRNLSDCRANVNCTRAYSAKACPRT
jgi:hypothetical protein